MASPFEDALADLHISGSVLLHERYAAPWAIEVPAEADLRTALKMTTTDRVVPFHLVRRGGFDLCLPRRSVLNVRLNDVAICPGGQAHRMVAGQATTATKLEDIIAGRGPLPAAGDAKDVTELICGVFILRAAPLNPLLAALPPALTVPTSGPGVDPMLAQAASMMASDLARTPTRDSFTTARLIEIFCAEAMRVYRSHAGATTKGWFRGLSDPRLAAAIAAVHEDPATPWTVASLAEYAALSPSRFAARFRDCLGETVLGYITRWRMNLACRLLRETELNLSEIAHRVGYDAPGSFIRAFKAALKMTPGAWRQMDGMDHMQEAVRV